MMVLGLLRDLGKRDGREARAPGPRPTPDSLICTWAASKVPEDHFKLGEAYEYGLGELDVCLSDAAAQYKIAANKGYVRAMLKMAVFYEGGRGCRRNLECAARWHRKAFAAQRALMEEARQEGRNEEDRESLMEMFAPAIHFFRVAAQNGDVDAQMVIAECYGDGLGVYLDLRISVGWYCRAACQGARHAQAKVGEHFALGRGVQRHLAKAWACFWAALMTGPPDVSGPFDDRHLEPAIRFLRDLKEDLNTGAAANLARCYELGRGVQRDLNMAFQLYLRAATDGNHVAMYHVGRCYEYGRGVPKQDWTKAVIWYRRSAEYNPAALFKLGLYYQTAGDNKEFKRHMAKAAAMGHPEAGFTKPDFWEIAASQGHRNAYVAGVKECQTMAPVVDRTIRFGGLTEEEIIGMKEEIEACEGEEGDERRRCEKTYKLAFVLINGLGEVQDDIEGVVWLQGVAGSRGDTDGLASYLLGLCYSYGRGVLPSAEEASKCFAAAQSCGFPANRLKKLGEKHGAEWFRTAGLGMQEVRFQTDVSNIGKGGTAKTEAAQASDVFRSHARWSNSDTGSGYPFSNELHGGSDCSGGGEEGGAGEEPPSSPPPMQGRCVRGRRMLQQTAAGGGEGEGGGGGGGGRRAGGMLGRMLPVRRGRMDASGGEEDEEEEEREEWDAEERVSSDSRGEDSWSDLGSGGGTEERGRGRGRSSRRGPPEYDFANSDVSNDSVGTVTTASRSQADEEGQGRYGHSRFMRTRSSSTCSLARSNGTVSITSGSSVEGSMLGEGILVSEEMVPAPGESMRYYWDCDKALEDLEDAALVRKKMLNLVPDLLAELPSAPMTGVERRWLGAMGTAEAINSQLPLKVMHQNPSLWAFRACFQQMMYASFAIAELAVRKESRVRSKYSSATRTLLWARPREGSLMADLAGVSKDDRTVGSHRARLASDLIVHWALHFGALERICDRTSLRLAICQRDAIIAAANGCNGCQPVSSGRFDDVDREGRRDPGLLNVMGRRLRGFIGRKEIQEEEMGRKKRLEVCDQVRDIAVKNVERILIGTERRIVLFESDHRDYEGLIVRNFVQIALGGDDRFL
ncbi:hypothetical protein CBR_g40527 [Chara braunii]|uniref:Uncharacterized protein n=1 Tax=Chara braunii TaxID=69332 RepID=A0A388K228_CHABU|nr:hypothetical protein CBR_g40527 [Chara braunii]|eukprot:GBG64079.1 hypothetical protein CBR_g40527 [Chara braunii]